MSSTPGPGALGLRLAQHQTGLHLLMTHLAGRAVRSRIEVDDLVQEVFLRALAQPRALPPEEAGDGALRRFLNLLARHVVIDVARALRAQKRAGNTRRLVRSDWSCTGAGPAGWGDVGEDQLAASLAGVATRLDQRDELARLTKAFRGLSADHRRVLGLRQFEGLDARTTAERMGRSETAVHSLYRRALIAWQAAASPDPG